MIPVTRHLFPSTLRDNHQHGFHVTSCRTVALEHGHYQLCDVAIDFSSFIKHPLLVFTFIHHRLEERCVSQGWQAIPLHIGKLPLLSRSKRVMEGQDDENESGGFECTANVSSQTFYIFICSVQNFPLPILIYCLTSMTKK